MNITWKIIADMEKRPKFLLLSVGYLLAILPGIVDYRYAGQTESMSQG